MSESVYEKEQEEISAYFYWRTGGCIMPRLKKKWMSPPATVSVVPAPPAPCKDFMNLKEAAAYFGVSVWSVLGLVAKGFIKAKRIGKYDVVRRTDLAEYWEKAA
jgi:excisionase family DNA binding protein